MSRPPIHLVDDDAPLSAGEMSQTGAPAPIEHVVEHEGGMFYENVFAENASSFDLRRLLRQHIWVLAVVSGLALLAYFIPSSPWWLAIPRALIGIVSFLAGAVRIVQINGIVRELARREAVAHDAPPEPPGGRRPDQAQSGSGEPLILPVPRGGLRLH